MILAKFLLGLMLFDAILVALLLTDLSGIVLAAFWLLVAGVFVVVAGPIMLWAALARRLKVGRPTRGSP